MARCTPAKDASGQQQTPQRETKNDGCAERPLVERHSRTPGQRLQLYRSKPVNIGIDRLQLGPVLRPEKLSLCRAGDLAQGPEIDTVFACRVRITEANSVDDDAILTRDVGGMLGWYPARGVIAIGEQDHEFLLGLARFECLDGEADAVPDDCLLARYADFGLIEQGARGLQVLSERHLDLGLAAEQDQRDTVALPA